MTNWLAEITERLRLLEEGAVPKCPYCRNYMLPDGEGWRCAFCVSHAR
jgi:tRNA(Ile2) C34 agmatinyltransferase TiaS